MAVYRLAIIQKKLTIVGCVFMGNKFHQTYKDLFGDDYQKETYRLEPHSFYFNKRIGKSVCSYCGLVYLKNPLTEWSVRMGCLSSEHPQYESKRKQLCPGIN
jgi:hypothetical protein